MQAAARLRGGYFGTRRAELFPPEFMRRIEPSDAFIDITAGTGQFPYRVALEQRKPIGLVERCDYVALLLKAVFDPSCAFSRTIKPSWTQPQSGYLTEALLHNKLLSEIFNRKMARFIDGVTLSDAPAAFKHTVIRVMGQVFFFRSRNWSRRDPKGRATIELVPSDLTAKIQRTFTKIYGLRSLLFNSSNAANANEVLIGDSCKKLAKLSLLPGATVYADPAWPYAKKFGGSNPYKFLYEQTGSIIRQRKLNLDTVWTLKNRKQILTDARGWIETAFANDARQFILCTQDTNYPDPDYIEAWADRHFRLKRTLVLDDFSASAHRKYQTFWYFLKP